MTSAPQSAPASFIVRIRRQDGQPAGMGMLVSGRRIMTCAHVVNIALGRGLWEQSTPDGLVTVDFPLAAPGHPPVRATVAAWLPPSRAGIAGEDVAGLELVEGDEAPDGTAPGHLAVEAPRAGRELRVFGYPGDPPRPDGVFVTATVRGLAGRGRLQLDSGPDPAHRVQPGFSGSPVFDEGIGRVVGLIAESPPRHAPERDSYAISADRLRLAWPETLAGSWQRGGLVTPGRGRSELTILHLSDTQFGAHHLFGGNGLTSADRTQDTLFGRLHQDLAGLAREHELRPDLLVVTGDLAEWGLPSEFRQVAEFLADLSEAAEIPRRHVAIVPGNHDINRKACEAYFAEQEADEAEPVAPYWPKWRQFASVFRDFYAGTGTATFTPDEPWTLFEMPELSVVVAGLNSTMAESHRDGDHYGWLGEHQLRWFAGRLAGYRDRGWLRLAAVHHNAVRGAVTDEENLRDADDLDRILGEPGLASLLLHGHTHDGKLHFLPSRLPVLSTGSAAVTAAARPAEVPNQYQLITVRRDGFTRHARQYAAGQRRWIGDTRISPTGSDWHDERSLELADVDAVFTEAPAEESLPASGDGRVAFLERVAEATRVSYPDATVTERPESGYLRVSRPQGDEGAEQWPVGVISGLATAEAVDSFATRVHAQFAAADPWVRSRLVYGDGVAPAQLVALARRRGVLLRSFVEYQGMIDLRPLAEAQRDRLATDWIYPAELYVEQRFRIASSGDTRAGLLDQVIEWLDTDDARLVVVLGDSGRGKTSFLRQLTRRLPDELPSVVPVLVELRTLEKAPTLVELLSQHLVRQGVEDISPAKLQYMIDSGRVGLLFDGFDELEQRVGYDNAAGYLQTLLASVTGNAKVVLTSRTQHFRSTRQVMTALGARVSALAASQVVELEDFSTEQITQCLTNLYGGDKARARTRFELLGDIPNLLDLARNPRLLAFVAGLDEERLGEVRREAGQLTRAKLYEEIVDYWLTYETDREHHEQGMPSFTKEDRLTACIELAFFLWLSAKPTIALSELSAAVSDTLKEGFAERGYTEAEAAHTIASRTLLVRAKDGAFTFIHQSVMEWLVAKGAANNSGQAEILTRRQMSPLMVEFFVDLAGVTPARRRADILATSKAQQAARQNALAIRDRLHALGHAVSVNQDLTGVDLRKQDMTGRDYSGNDLRGAILRGMRLAGTDLSGADLRDADLRGIRMTGGSLTGAHLEGSRWDRAAILGTRGLDDLAATPDLADAAIVGRDPAEVMIRPPFSPNRVAFSPDGTLLVVGSSGVAEIIDVAEGRVLRLLQGHAGLVADVAFSPDGTLIATASSDGTARTWDAATGTPRTTLTGHHGAVTAIAFSPHGALLATASSDRTARIWDAVTGTPRTTLTGHHGAVTAIAFSPVSVPEDALLATASTDGTARTWEVATGAPRTTFTGHHGTVNDVAFSPDGALLATASGDGTARTWDAVTGTRRTTLTGHHGAVTAIAFSPVSVPEDALLATASTDGTALAWEVATGTLRTTLTGHRGILTGVAFSHDGTLIATASGDGTARTWDADTGARRTTLTGDYGIVTDVAFSRDGALLATASSDGTARTWDVATGTRRTTFTGHRGAVTDVAFSRDGALLATASSDGTARTWDADTGTPRTDASRPGPATAIAFTPDGGHLVGAFSDGTIRTWETATSIVARNTRTGDHGAVSAVAFSHDGALLATASGDGTVRTWDTTAAGTPRATFAGHGKVTAVAFSPDGTLIATAPGDGTARTWDTATRTPRTTLTGLSATVTAIAFSPDGTLIATASSDATVRTWDTATGTPRATFTGHHGPVTAVAFSPDGTLLATASSDGTARIWNTETGAVAVTLVSLPRRSSNTTVLRDSGYAAVLPDGSYKLDGEPGDRLWWAIKLCRFAPGELDPYVAGLKLLKAGSRLPGSA